MRERILETLKGAMREKDMPRVSTLRLIMAALKDRDIAVREKGNYEGIGETEILQMLQGMVKQRKEVSFFMSKGVGLILWQKKFKKLMLFKSFFPNP